ncbi:hypothetical protein Tco_0173215 [Tanacetum coccineum]
MELSIASDVIAISTERTRRASVVELRKNVIGFVDVCMCCLNTGKEIIAKEKGPIKPKAAPVESNVSKRKRLVEDKEVEDERDSDVEGSDRESDSDKEHKGSEEADVSNESEEEGKGVKTKVFKGKEKVVISKFKKWNEEVEADVEGNESEEDDESEEDKESEVSKESDDFKTRVKDVKMKGVKSNKTVVVSKDKKQKHVSDSSSEEEKVSKPNKVSKKKKQVKDVKKRKHVSDSSSSYDKSSSSEEEKVLKPKKFSKKKKKQVKDESSSSEDEKPLKNKKRSKHVKDVKKKKKKPLTAEQIKKIEYLSDYQVCVLGQCLLRCLLQFMTPKLTWNHFCRIIGLESKVMRECCFVVERDAWLRGLIGLVVEFKCHQHRLFSMEIEVVCVEFGCHFKVELECEFTLSLLDVLQGFSFFLQIGFTLILATLDGLDVGLLGDVIGEDDCDDDG